MSCLCLVSKQPQLGLGTVTPSIGFPTPKLGMSWVDTGHATIRHVRWYGIPGHH